MKNGALGDQPLVCRTDAAIFFGMGENKFKKRWTEHYRYIIRHVETTRGLRLLLTDVIEAAFPEATSETVGAVPVGYG